MSLLNAVASIGLHFAEEGHGFTPQNAGLQDNDECMYDGFAADHSTSLLCNNLQRWHLSYEDLSAARCVPNKDELVQLIKAWFCMY